MASGDPCHLALAAPSAMMTVRPLSRASSGKRKIEASSRPVRSNYPHSHGLIEASEWPLPLLLQQTENGTIKHGFPFSANKRYLIGFVQHGIRSGENDKTEEKSRLPEECGQHNLRE